MCPYKLDLIFPKSACKHHDSHALSHARRRDVANSITRSLVKDPEVAGPQGLVDSLKSELNELS